MSSVNLNLSKLKKIYIHFIASGLLAGIGLMSGLIPEVSIQSRSIELSNHVYAQQFTPEEIQNYAKAGYKVELLRREVYREIKSSINQPPPNIVCDRQETIQSLEPNIREIANQFCGQSLQIVEQHNLSIDRYNELKSYYDRRDGFYQQVQNVLLKLQN